MATTRKQETAAPAVKLAPLASAWRHAATLRQSVETAASDETGIAAAKFNRMFATVDAYVSFASYLREQIVPRLPEPERAGMTGNALWTLATTAGSAIYCADESTRKDLGSNAYFTRALQFAALDTATLRESYRADEHNPPQYATYLTWLQIMCQGKDVSGDDTWQVTRSKAGKVTAASKVRKTRQPSGQRAPRTTATPAAPVAALPAVVADIIAGTPDTWHAIVDAPESAALADLSAIAPDMLLPLARLLLAAALLQSATPAAPATALQSALVSA